MKESHSELPRYFCRTSRCVHGLVYVFFLLVFTIIEASLLLSALYFKTLNALHRVFRQQLHYSIRFSFSAFIISAIKHYIVFSLVSKIFSCATSELLAELMWLSFYFFLNVLIHIIFIFRDVCLPVLLLFKPRGRIRPPIVRCCSWFEVRCSGTRSLGQTGHSPIDEPWWLMSETFYLIFFFISICSILLILTNF